MSEFKGTQGNWKISSNTEDGLIISAISPSVRDISTVWKYGNDFLELKEFEANAKLIECAPDMFKEIQETIVDLKILRNQIIDANKTNHLFDGMDDLMDKWIERKEDLIKKSTE